MAFRRQLPRENRVKPFSKWGKAIRPGDPRLEQIPSNRSWKKVYCHWRAARAFILMVNAAAEDGFTMRANNALRQVKWETKQEYEAALQQKYPTLSLRQAKRKLGWKGGHHLGLAIDLGTPAKKLTLTDPWAPTFGKGDKWKRAMQAHPMYDWLIDNAARFGFTPYNYEPWHWEFHISKEEWLQLPDNSGEYHPPEIARAKTMANYSRRDAQRGTDTQGINDLAQELFQIATNTQTYASLSLDTTNPSGLLYDFEAGQWVE